MNNKEIFVMTVKSKLITYHKMTRLIKNREDLDGRSHVTQNELAELLDLSQINISVRLNKLIEHNSIVKVKRGVYKVINEDLEDTVFKKVRPVAELYFDRPEFKNDYIKQIELLELNLTDIQTAWGFINLALDK